MLSVIMLNVVMLSVAMLAHTLALFNQHFYDNFLSGFEPLILGLWDECSAAVLPGYNIFGLKFV